MRYLWALAVLMALSGSAEAATLYASNTGAGASPCTTISPAASRCPTVTALTAAVAGDTVQLLGGTMASPAVYLGANYMVVPPTGKSGTSLNPITVQCADIAGAVNDNACLIDGQFLRVPVSLTDSNNWWIIEGINARHGTSAVARIVTNSNNNIIRRGVFWDARLDLNSDVCAAHAAAGPNLFEDVGCFGTGRKVFGGEQHGDNLTCRRCWLRWDGSINVGPKMTVTTNYTSDNMTLEDVIVTWSGSMMPGSYRLLNNGAIWTGTGSGTYTTVQSQQGVINRDVTDGCNTSATLQGVLVYVLSTDQWFSGQLPLTTLGGQSGSGAAQSCTSVTNSLAVMSPSHTQFSNTKGWSFGSSGTSNSYDNLTSIRGLDDSFGNWAHTTTPSTGTSLAAVQDPWTTTGSGANLCSKSNVVPTAARWPFPMNAAVSAATGMSGNYFSNGGPGCGAATGNCTGIPSAVRSAIDVTSAVESLLGTIPSACRTDASESFEDFVGYPTNGQITAFGGSSTPPVGFATVSGSDWVEGSGVAAAGTNFGTARYDTLLGPNQEVWAEITTLPPVGSGLFLNFLLVDSNNRYRVYANNITGTDNDTIIVDKVVSGTTTTLATVNLNRDIATADRLGIRVTDTEIKVGYYTTWSSGTGWKLVTTTTATSAPAESYIGMGGRSPLTLTQFGGGGGSANDTTAPTAPSNLTVTPQGVIAISLSWTASTDAVGVTEYHIFRGAQSNCSDCTQIGTNTTNAYTDNTASPGTTLYYRVTALDAALNESSPSSTVVGRIPDGPAFIGSSGRAR